MIRTDAGTYLWLAALLLLMPLEWIMAAIAAALVHELCHLLVLLLLGGKVRKVHISIEGCVIEAVVHGNWQSLSSILAGPVGSFTLLLFSRIVPRIAVCGLFHGIYNLLPVLPLDGGRALQLILHFVCPEQAQCILMWTAGLTLLLIFAAAVWCTLVGNCGILPIFAATVLVMKHLPRKIPCKPPKIGVQ